MGACHDTEWIIRNGLGLNSSQGRDLSTMETEADIIPCSSEKRSDADSTEQKDVIQSLSADMEEQVLELYDKFRPRLLRYIRSMYLNIEQAEEMIQEAFTRLATELTQGHDIDNVQGWIVRVVHNLAVDKIKEKERYSDHFCTISLVHIATCIDPSKSPEDEYLRNEKVRQVEMALLTLNLQQRQCYNMRVQGLRYKDIGLALGVSEQRAALIVKQVSVRLAAICG